MFRRRLILIGVCAVVLCGAISIWQMTRLPPAWYAPPPAFDPAVIELADRVEYRLVQEAQQIRPPENPPWTLRIREDQINAWLAARLRKWIEREEGARWPEHLGVPQVRFDDDGISIAIPLIDDSDSRFIVARIRPEMDSGLLRLTLNRIALGRMSIPGAPVTFLANALSGATEIPNSPSSNDGLFAEIVNWLGNSEPVDPVLSLSDGRRVRLLDVRMADGVIDLTAQTLAERSD